MPYVPLLCNDVPVVQPVCKQYWNWCCGFGHSRKTDTLHTAAVVLPTTREQQALSKTTTPHSSSDLAQQDVAAVDDSAMVRG